MNTAHGPGFRFLRSAQAGGEEWPWFTEHHSQAPRELLDFLAGDDLSLDGLEVADVGCGDGIIDLGLVHAGRPKRLVGYDLEQTDTDRLLSEARAAGVVETALPSELSFRTNTLEGLPAPANSYDAVVSWSAFEHVRDPVAVLREIERVLRPDGFFFLQIWPLYFSEHGSHLWAWYPDGFAQLRHPFSELEERLVDAEGGHSPEVDFVLDEVRGLNKITVDELQKALLAARLYVTKFELITGATRISRELQRYPLSHLGVAGIKLIAIPSTAAEA